MLGGSVEVASVAAELAAEGVGPLPVATSDGLPDYMAYPKHELTDASFERGYHRLLDASSAEGVRYRFLVGTVLARGIPNATRAAFEAEALSGSVEPAELAVRFPGIANAYSAQQWQAVFEPLLGPGQDFGAVWGGYDRPQDRGAPAPTVKLGLTCRAPARTLVIAWRAIECGRSSR